MNIGDVAEASGLPAKTIRYYEDIGLVRPKRGQNGYRAFSEADVYKLAFLSRPVARAIVGLLDRRLSLPNVALRGS